MTACAPGYAPAAKSEPPRAWADFVTYCDFPEEHWVHLRTSNPIESILSGVRLRTNAGKRLRVPESALYLVFKLVLRLSLNWRGINAPNQLRLLLAGHQFPGWSIGPGGCPRPHLYSGRRSMRTNQLTVSSKGGDAAS